jgi:hypothetical protein
MPTGQTIQRPPAHENQPFVLAMNGVYWLLWNCLRRVRAYHRPARLASEMHLHSRGAVARLLGSRFGSTMNMTILQTLGDDLWCRQRDLYRKTAGILSAQLLKIQNRVFAGTLGISRNNRHLGFVPAYYDTTSGTATLSRFANGNPAPIHLLDGLPAEWVLERDAGGRVLKARPGVVAGFLRDNCFYTREEAARALSH